MFIKKSQQIGFNDISRTYTAGDIYDMIKHFSSLFPTRIGFVCCQKREEVNNKKRVEEDSSTLRR